MNGTLGASEGHPAGPCSSRKRQRGRCLTKATGFSNSLDSMRIWPARSRVIQSPGYAWRESHQMRWPVVGHELAVRLLQQAVASGQLSHAYLLSGPPLVGRTTLARACAQALLCTEDDAPCGACRACRNVREGVHPDLHIIEPRTTNLLIEQVRDLQHQAALSPLEAPYKVFILRRIEQATTAAANALLKTLEEPPPHVVLFLTLTEGESTLPTVASRCQRITLRPLPAPSIAHALRERWNVPADRSELLARLSQGRLGWAVAILGDDTTWEQREQDLQELAALPEQGRVERLRYAEQLSKRDPAKVHGVLNLWTGWWRDLLLVQHGCPAQVANIDCLTTLRSDADRYDALESRGFLGQLTATVRYLEQNVNTRLALELLLLRLPRPSQLQSSQQG